MSRGYLSRRSIIIGENCFVELSWGTFSRCYLSGGQLSGMLLSGGNCPKWEFGRGNCLEENSPRGQLFWGNLSLGQLSKGSCPEGKCRVCTDWFSRRRELKISLVFISQCFKVVKTAQMELNHLSDIEFKGFMKPYKDYTKGRLSFVINNKILR